MQIPEPRSAPWIVDATPQQQEEQQRRWAKFQFDLAQEWHQKNNLSVRGLLTVNAANISPPLPTHPLTSRHPTHPHTPSCSS